MYRVGKLQADPWEEGQKEAKRKNELLPRNSILKVTKSSSRLRLVTGVAVLVDGTYMKQEQGPTGNRRHEDRKVRSTDEQEIESLIQLSKSVGFNEERGDQIEVVNVAPLKPP